MSKPDTQKPNWRSIADPKAKRAAMLAIAKTGPEGGKLFIVGDASFYRLGVTYPPGAQVELPAGEEPSITFTPVEDGAPVAAPAVTPNANKQGRAADRDVA